MNVMQAMIDAGINAFGAQLTAESFLKSPLAQQALDRGEPLRFFLPIRRCDCSGWSGVEITLAAVPATDRIEALGAAIRAAANVTPNVQADLTAQDLSRRSGRAPGSTTGTNEERKFP